ncbi:hypothetical protein [Streptomyces pinistramenti]|uniref:hypothetical protein n=1 Tax=Streptomyces pinistramenti TaxID=2884812 RepID=UPI001D06FFFE|nr:hypothetical protein [Streptomyces pinistramenti]MCB5907447.1 hypothetical protein [Streptomyces pinistramenti]
MPRKAPECPDSSARHRALPEAAVAAGSFPHSLPQGIAHQPRTGSRHREDTPPDAELRPLEADVHPAQHLTGGGFVNRPAAFSNSHDKEGSNA